tara:strand:+ start:98 stop:454 length:357 start_codon:yes stop_codon:yes gene_type:complete
VKAWRISVRLRARLLAGRGRPHWVTEEGIDGKGPTRQISQSLNGAWVLQHNTEAGVSLIYRNDNGVNAGTEATVIRVDAKDFIVCMPNRLAETGAKFLPRFLGITPEMAPTRQHKGSF